MKKISSIGLICQMILSVVNAQNPGDNFFPLPIIHTVELIFTQQNFWDSLIYYKQQGDLSGTYHYMPAQVTINGTLMDSIGVRLKGNSSFSLPGVKKPIKLEFNRFVDGQEYDRLQKLNLNNGFKDPTMLREKIMLDFCDKLSIPAPRAAFAKVYINGDYWGLYSAVEQVDDQFLKTWFSSDNGNLFKGDPSGSLSWISANETDYYPHYELKNNEIVNDWSDLVHLINIINNTSPSQFHDSIQTVLNTEIFIKAWAATMLFVNLDSYQGSGHNYYIYHDFYLDYFQWIIWDVNEAFGNFQMSHTVPELEDLDVFFAIPQQLHPLSIKMINDNDYKNQYADELCNMISTEFSPEMLFPLIDSLADAIRADLYADINKMYTNQQFENNLTNNIQGGMGWIPGLKSFITARQINVNNQLLSYGCWPLEAAGQVPDVEEVRVLPNPFHDKLSVICKRYYNNATIKIYDIEGKQLVDEILIGNHTEIKGLHLRPGMYFYIINSNEGEVLTGKLIAE